MYGYPTFVAPFSNREDFLLPVSVFDDDTGDPINLAGITGSGTFNSWNVMAGGQLTTSVTSITIPQYPVGNQLSTLALTVGTGLTIPAGSPITISDASGNNTMVGYVLTYVPTTGAMTAQIGSTFQFEVRRKLPRLDGTFGTGFAPFFDFGSVSELGPVLTASLGNGVLITALGFLQVRIPEIKWRQLHPHSYAMGLVMTDSQDTRQVFIADLPILFGNVTQ